MSVDLGDDAHPELRVRLSAETASVPGARRFVCDGLLTLAATPEMESLRTWFTESMVGQLEHDAEPVAYEDWLAARA